MSLKEEYEIIEITKKQAKEIIKQYHYLKNKDFLFMCAYGLYDKKTKELMGCATFGRVNGISATKGWFGIGNGAEESKGLYELNRLVMNPSLNGGNETSFLLGGALRRIKKDYNARAIISLADTDLHVGYIYQACNFTYHGMTDVKTDFYMQSENDKGFKLNPIGSTKDKNGVWLPRSQKHRYLMLFDKSVKVQYPQKPYPKVNNIKKKSCCDDKIVIDKRFGITYTCPKCTGKLEIIPINTKQENSNE